MISTWKRWLLALGMVALLAASGCGGGSDEAKLAGEGTPQSLTKVTAGYLPIFIYAPYFVALEKGYFKEQGIDLELKVVPQGGGQILTQVVAGNLDTGAGGIGPAAFNLAKET